MLNQRIVSGIIKILFNFNRIFKNLHKMNSKEQNNFCEWGNYIDSSTQENEEIAKIFGAFLFIIVRIHLNFYCSFSMLFVGVLEPVWPSYLF